MGDEPTRFAHWLGPRSECLPVAAATGRPSQRPPTAAATRRSAGMWRSWSAPARPTSFSSPLSTARLRHTSFRRRVRSSIRGSAGTAGAFTTRPRRPPAR
jgi:hypothetical protein